MKHLLANTIFKISTIISLSVASANILAMENDSLWIPIWKQNPQDWTPYFPDVGVNKNPGPIFTQSPEGFLLVDIVKPINGLGFGHYFYTKRKFSNYLVRIEYKFVNSSNGTEWAKPNEWNYQNNGLMLHSEDPFKMKPGTQFPASIEVQLLGMKNTLNGNFKEQGFRYTFTANLCTPGTFVSWRGNNNYTEHCTAAQYPTTWKNTEIPWEANDGFSDVTVKVLADSMEHYIHGTQVFSYGKIRLDNGSPLREGYIAIQAEGTSTVFRKIEVLDLEGCMEKGNPNYRSYFVVHQPLKCDQISGIKNISLKDAPFSLQGRELKGSHSKNMEVSLFSPKGKRLYSVKFQQPGSVILPVTSERSMWLRISCENKVYTKKVVWP